MKVLIKNTAQLLPRHIFKLLPEKNTFELVIVIPVNWYISTYISTSINEDSEQHLKKRPTEMCHFTRIVMSTLIISFRDTISLSAYSYVRISSLLYFLIFLLFTTTLLHINELIITFQFNVLQLFMCFLFVYFTALVYLAVDADCT